MRHPLPPLLIAVAAAATAVGCGSSGHSAAPPVTVTVVSPTVTLTPSPTSTSTPTPTATPTPTPTQPKPTPAPIPAPPAPTLSAVQVVEAYYAAINAHDYRTAWNLLANNSNSDYNAFANGFAGTADDLLTVTGVQGDVVSIRLSAVQTDGSVKLYQGTYTVRNGRVVGASVQQVGTVPPTGAQPSSSVIRPPGGGFYSRGEFCPTEDAGLTTVDASGNIFICVLESGGYHWR